jgi:exopolyphosphatase/guanosine-5'-triphosphate,3'-diphosphate pyrophosphatase
MTRPARLAVIEVGTKGIRLLVAERCDPPEGLMVLKSKGGQANLGAGLVKHRGRMQPDNLDRTLALVHEYQAEAEAFRPDQVVVVGTEVLRRAANADEFRDRLPKPLDLRVLEPEEEAVGSFLAACWGFRHDLPAPGQLILLDLGGGSLEVVGGIQGIPPLPVRTISFRAMGTLTLREVWQRYPEPIRREAELARHIEADMSDHAAEMAFFRPPRGSGLVVGLGSTVTTSAWVLHKGVRERYRSDRIHGLRVSVEDLEGLRRRLLEIPRLGNPLGVPDPLGHQVGLAGLLAILRYLEVSALAACGTGLRFGLAYAVLHGLSLTLAENGMVPGVAASDRPPTVA